MKLFAGIDGGQSATSAVVGTADGRIIGRGEAGPADEIAESSDSTRLHDALQGALHAALRHARLQTDLPFVSAVAGVSGYEGRVYGKSPELNVEKLSLVHDASIAHAGALSGNPGVTVVCGTGSSAYGTNEDAQTVCLGGWGYLFGDEGSGFWIARRALERVMRDNDAGLRSQLREPLLAHFAIQSAREIVRAFYAGEISRRALAAAAPSVMKLAREGVADAGSIVDQAADALAALAALTARRLHGNKRVLDGPVRVAFTGGLTKDRWFYEKLVARLADRLPEAVVVQPRYGSAIGALLLAYREAGVQTADVRE